MAKASRAEPRTFLKVDFIFYLLTKKMGLVILNENMERPPWHVGQAAIVAVRLVVLERDARGRAVLMFSWVIIGRCGAGAGELLASGRSGLHTSAGSSLWMCYSKRLFVARTHNQNRRYVALLFCSKATVKFDRVAQLNVFGGGRHYYIVK